MERGHGEGRAEAVRGPRAIEQDKKRSFLKQLSNGEYLRSGWRSFFRAVITKRRIRAFVVSNPTTTEAYNDTKED